MTFDKKVRQGKKRKSADDSASRLSIKFTGKQDAKLCLYVLLWFVMLLEGIYFLALLRKNWDNSG